MSKTEILFTNPECDIFYNKELQIIQTLWKGLYVQDEPLRRILDQIIEALELKQASIVVADAREMHIISKSDQDWILDSWYPRAVRAGFRHQGLILSKDTYNELTIKKISGQYDDTLVTTQYFRSPLQALEWVREIQMDASS
jgi:hypothetical protein